MSATATQPPVLQRLDKCFADSLANWRGIAEELRIVFASTDDATLLSCRLPTRFILKWMCELKGFHKQFGSQYRRQKCPPLADDFTSAVAFCLEQYLSARDCPARVRSEATLHKTRKAKRPDVSVMSRQGHVVAIVECKTNFNWSRKKWKTQWDGRVMAIQATHPTCDMYLCVLHQKKSSEFATSESFQKQWFCLTNKGLGKVSSPLVETDIFGGVEPLFFAILQKLRASEAMPTPS